MLGTPRVDAWCGVTIGRREPFDTLQLWLATALDGFCLLTVNRDLDSGPLSPVNRIASPAVAEDASFAYLASRRLDEATVEFGASAFGPGAAVLAEAMAEQVRVWDRAYRGGPAPVIAAYPAGTPDNRLPDGLVIDKRHVRVTVSWPRAGLLAVGQGVQHHNAMPRFLGPPIGTKSPCPWTTAHGDFHFANLCAPTLHVLDFEGWGRAPAGYDAATLHSYSLLVPAIAARVRRELAWLRVALS